MVMPCVDGFVSSENSGLCTLDSVAIDAGTTCVSGSLNCFVRLDREVSLVSPASVVLELREVSVLAACASTTPMPRPDNASSRAS